MAESTLGKSSSPLAREIEAALSSGTVPEPLRITLTPSALEHAESMVKQDKSLGIKPLRFYLDGKGCDGFFYGVAFSDPLPEDLVYKQGELTLVVDKETFPFIAGSIVDWVDDERGKGFLVENPHHKRFRGKFFKKKAWQDYFTDKKVASQTNAPKPGADSGSRKEKT
jgi:iron-sulfur cluster assembly accessory protein